MPTAAGSLGVLAGVLLLTVAVAGPGDGVRAATPIDCTTTTPTPPLVESTATTVATEGSGSASPSVSAEADTPTPTAATATSTATSAVSPAESSATPTTAATATPTHIATATATPSLSPAASASSTDTPTPTVEGGASPSSTPTSAATPTHTATAATPTDTSTETATLSPSPSPVASPTPTDTATALAAAATEEPATAAATTTEASEAAPITGTGCATPAVSASEAVGSATPSGGTGTPGTAAPSATGAASTASATTSPGATVAAEPFPKVECQWVASMTITDPAAAAGPEHEWSDRCSGKAPGGATTRVKANAGDLPGIFTVTVWTIVENGKAATPVQQSVRRPDGTTATLAVEFVEMACSGSLGSSPDGKCASGSRALYRSALPISYRDQCGTYELETSIETGPVEKLSFENECFVAVDLDFAAISWGRIVPGAVSGVTGDLEWQRRGTGGPSVKNIGNAPMILGITFSPLSMAGEAPGTSTPLQEFRACLGTAPGEPRCAEAIRANETTWIGETLGQAVCPGQMARLDVFVVPPQTVPQGDYEGSLSLPARMGPASACAPEPRS